MVPLNKKVLVAFYTKSGATKEYAQIIADTLADKGLSVETQNLSQTIPDISEYDIIILGTGVRMSMVYRRWKKILKQKEINTKKLYLFLSSGMAAEEPEKAVEKFIYPIMKKYNLKPELMVSFPGKIPDKWAKYDDTQKIEMNPDLAKQWANQIASHIIDQ